VSDTAPAGDGEEYPTVDVEEEEEEEEEKEGGRVLGVMHHIRTLPSSPVDTRALSAASADGRRAPTPSQAAPINGCR